MYENICKILPCNFLALSATIGNIQDLQQFFSKIHPLRDIQFIEYNQRFINQQRWIWNDTKIQKIHPLSCITLQDLQDDFVNHNLSFTPHDSACLWNQLESTFEDTELENEIDKLSPDNYFKESRILTLNDSKTYETVLK